MLVLTRHRDESIMIGDDIAVQVIDVRGDKVRLGIAAPLHVQVHRKEVYDQIKAENQQAGQIHPADVAHVLAPVQQPTKMKMAAEAPPSEHDVFIQAAIEEARRGMAEGGLPMGAVLVRHGQIIGRGYNQSIQTGDRTLQAEMICLRNAGPQTTYGDAVFYTTFMPGYLSAGAAAQLGVPKIVVGAANEGLVEIASPRSHENGIARFLKSAGIELIDLRDSECVEMARAFVRDHPRAGGFQE